MEGWGWGSCPFSESLAIYVAAPVAMWEMRPLRLAFWGQSKDEARLHCSRLVLADPPSSLGWATRAGEEAALVTSLVFAEVLQQWREVEPIDV